MNDHRDNQKVYWLSLFVTYLYVTGIASVFKWIKLGGSLKDQGGTFLLVIFFYSVGFLLLALAIRFIIRRYFQGKSMQWAAYAAILCTVPLWLWIAKVWG